MVPTDELSVCETVVVHERAESTPDIRLLLRGELAGGVRRVAVAGLILPNCVSERH